MSLPGVLFVAVLAGDVGSAVHLHARAPAATPCAPGMPPCRHRPPPAHGLLRLRGGQEAAQSPLAPSQAQIANALAALGPAARSVPPSLQRAVRDGRVGLSMIDRFVQWHKRLPRSLRWLLQIGSLRNVRLSFFVQCACACACA